MQFGLFDHCERNSQAAGVTYAERLSVARRAEEAGFYGYHLAEHHGTPLSLVPSPSVFLAALSQHTTTLRFGPLVYLLPLYDPYRLAQEICMLDNLSGGRFELGIGRGASPFELEFFGLSPDDAQEMFHEAYQILKQGLVDGHIRFQGKRYSFPNAPLDIQPVQRPHPPIWYPTSNAAGSLGWAARQGFNTVVNGPLASITEAVRAFKDNFVPATPGASPMIGMVRYVFIAETDDEAMEVGARALKYHLDNLSKLARDAGETESLARILPPADFKETVRQGWVAAGSPATVRQQLGDLFDRVGNNYFLFAPLIGDVTVDWGLRSVDLFRTEIMPAFQSEGLATIGA